jgi:hypothetical protein
VDSSRAPLRTPPPSIDKYELVEKLGEGGFGVVYKARHRVTQHPVAIKILITSADAHPEVALRFRREASIGNAIDHENIVRAIDFGEVSGQPYLVLEFLDGESLGDNVRRQGPMGPARAARICAQVADALAAAHAHHVIHRDLKPENIFLVQRSGQDDFVKVLDFGIAKLTANAPDAVKTRSHMLLGSPLTMSPEQCRSADIDWRSDIYALGVVLFFAVAGRYPFMGQQGEVLSAHLRDEPPRLREVKPSVPPALEAIVVRALAKDPDARFQSMSELRRALLPLAQVHDAATLVLRGNGGVRGRGRVGLLALVMAGMLVAAGVGARQWLGRAKNNLPEDATFVSAAPISEKEANAATEMKSERSSKGGNATGTTNAAVGITTRATVDGTNANGTSTGGTNGEVEVRRNGYLTIAVLPFAEVTIDGRAAGTTPLRNVSLRPGVHTIELRNDGLRRRTRRTEHIEPGAHHRIQLDWSDG